MYNSVSYIDGIEDSTKNVTRLIILAGQLCLVIYGIKWRAKQEGKLSFPFILILVIAGLLLTYSFSIHY